MREELYFLNFKRVLVILTNKSMRKLILEVVDLNQIDVNLKFVDSYHQAALLIQENIHDPFNHVILNTEHSNKKLSDFLEYLQETFSEQEDFVIPTSLLLEKTP